MVERVHGIDPHKQFSTITVQKRQEEEVQFELTLVFQGSIYDEGRSIKPLPMEVVK